MNGVWTTAEIGGTPPDTTGQGSGNNIHPDLKSYMGTTPLYFDIPDEIGAGSTIIVEISYVELLPYEFGNVDFYHPNNYQLIQSGFVDLQELVFNRVSPRAINSVSLMSSHNIDTLTVNQYDAYLVGRTFESNAAEDYHVQYSLDLNDLGLFGFSTLIPNDQLPDTYGGFFTFIAEPDPGTTTDVLQKVFTLIIDRSGSMAGTKIVQARDAASFIVENLNDGDKFNIVDFSSSVTSFRSDHVDFNPTTKSQALNYISNIIAGGGTNIAGAFDTAIPQFSTANDSTANIIIFFTEGQATVGITGTQDIVNHVNQLVTQYESNVMIFTFGIGTHVNEQLLTLLASQHSGLAVFLGNDELFSVITSFYLKIRNPVLLNTQISFSPQNIRQVFPDPLPNLYKGQQMIVSGRYTEPVPVTVTLSGDAFGQAIEYNYNLVPADSAVESYRFLTKVWAKAKIEYLLIQYYTQDPGSPEEETIKQQIIDLSIGYGVLSPFTDFTEPTFIDEEMLANEEITPRSIELLGNYPNPFNPVTRIRLQLNQPVHELILIKIYKTLGQLVRVHAIQPIGTGIFEVVWGGRLQDGGMAPSGIYVYLVEIGDVIKAGKMTLLR